MHTDGISLARHMGQHLGWVGMRGALFANEQRLTEEATASGEVIDLRARLIETGRYEQVVEADLHEQLIVMNRMSRHEGGGAQIAQPARRAA